MTPDERDSLLEQYVEDLESTIAEFAMALDHDDTVRGNRALDDIEAIVQSMRGVWA